MFPPSRAGGTPESWACRAQGKRAPQEMSHGLEEIQPPQAPGPLRGPSSAQDRTEQGIQGTGGEQAICSDSAFATLPPWGFEVWSRIRELLTALHRGSVLDQSVQHRWQQWLGAMRVSPELVVFQQPQLAGRTRPTPPSLCLLSHIPGPLLKKKITF